jgi:uncharacterized cofD-like protein
MNLRAWLRPGIGVKRWLAVVFIGELLLALALALVLRQFYREVDVDGPVQAVVYLVTLQFLPYWARGLVLAGLGLALFAAGSVRLVRAVTDPLRQAGPDRALVEVIYQKRFLARGPHIVAIGGGTGLSTLLRGLKEHTSNLTAVVTVADDGGSSGALRAVLGIPPVGDIRNCIVALADAEPLMGPLLQYRFPGEPTRPDEPVSDRLTGHAMGNLLIAAMAAIEGGDFEEGVRQVNRVLAVRGRVLPVSPTPLTLHARVADGQEVVGQSRIARERDIEQVWIEPADVRASAEALEAIAAADAIVLGPGSLFTSLLPALLVPGIRDAVAASPALRIFVCNVATQPGETSDLDLADHVETLVGHTRPELVDVVLANNDFGARGPSHWSGAPVQLRWPPESTTARLVLEAVVDPANAHHHDPARLASAIVRVLEREGSRQRRNRTARTA